MTLEMLMRKARLMVATGIVKLVNDATKIQQQQLALLNEEVRDQVNRMQPYGHSSNPRPGAEALAVAVGGNRNHLVVVVVDDGRYRKKNLASGEHALYHWEGDYIHFKNGRIIDVVAGNAVNVTAPEVTVVATTKVKLQTPLVEVTQHMTVGGNLTANGTVTGGEVKSAAGRNLDTLRVTGVQPGSGVSGTPQ